MTERALIEPAFVALHALPAMSSDFAGPIGGTETRAWTLARGLTRHVADVKPSIVVRGSREHVPAAIDDVAIVVKNEPLYEWYLNVGRSIERQAGFLPVRLVRFNSRLLWQLPIVAAHRLIRSRPTDPIQPERFFERLSSNVLVAFGVQSTAATVIASAKAAGRPSVVVLGCDDDLDSRYVSDAGFINPYGDSGRVCRWILENADAVIAQTKWQQERLQERFGRDGHVVPNPIDLSVWTSANALAGASVAGASVPGASLRGASVGGASGGDRSATGIAKIEAMSEPFVLWVGRAERVHKRPQKLIELALQCPEVPFVMVMNSADPELETEIRRDRPANVEIVDRVAPAHMPAVFRRAAILVNTSLTEGFPNTFLQAAATGVPVLSLVVLGELLVDKRLGRAFDENVGAMADAVRSTYAERVSGQRVSIFDAAVAYDFVQKHHGLESVVEQFANVLRSVVRGR